MLFLAVFFSAFTFPPKENKVATQSCSSYPNYSKVSTFKKYHVLVTSNFILGNCTFYFSMTLTFNWNGPGTPPTNMLFSNAQIAISCSSGMTQGKVASYTFDENTGEFANLEFDPTDNDYVNDLLTNSDFLNNLKALINESVNSQKDF